MVAWQNFCCHALLEGKKPLDSFCLIEDFCLSNSKGQSILIINLFFFLALYVNFHLQTGRKESCFLSSGHAECLSLAGGVSRGWPFPWGPRSASSPSCRFCVALWGEARGACMRQHGRHLWVPVWALMFSSWNISFLWLFSKLPQPWWLKAAQIYFLTVLEARSPKSVSQGSGLCWQGWSLLETLGENSFLVFSGIWRLPASWTAPDSFLALLWPLVPVVTGPASLS